MGLISYTNPKFGEQGAIRASLVCGAEKLSFKTMKYHLANQYVREHEKFGRKLKNKISANNQFRNFMVALDEGSDVRDLSNGYKSVRTEFIEKGLVYYRSPADVVYRESRRLGRGSCSLYLPEPASIESVKNDQVFINLGDAANTYISEHLDVRKAIQKYFEHYNYNKASQDCVNYLFQKVLGPDEFFPNPNDYISATSPIYRNASAQNTALDMTWSPNSIELGYQGFQNILAALNELPENYGKMGFIIEWDWQMVWNSPNG